MASNRLDLIGVSAFCESMGTMIRAGVQIADALSLFRQKKEKAGGVLDNGIALMEKSVNEGNSLASAMKESGLFPEYALEMVATGEDTGKLEDVLFKLADYYSAQSSIAAKVKAALLYPASMLVMIIIVLFIMLKAVLPSFEGVYNTLTGSLSSSSFRYLNYAYLFCEILLVAMVLLLIFVVVAYLMWKGKGKDKIEALLAKNRRCASILENLALYRFTSAFEVLLSAGEMQDDALRKAAEMADYKPVNDKLAEVKQKMDLEGLGFARAANDVELYEPIYGRMLIPGEQSGNTDEILSRLIKLISGNIINELDSLINTLEPLFSTLLMIAIAIALLALMLPLIGIMNSIG